MKRDWELIRTILLTVEEHDPEDSRAVDETDFVGAETWVLQEHVGLLNKRGLVEAGTELGGGFAIFRLTWEGHDFLDAIRSEGAMRHIQEKAKATGGALTFEMVKALGSAWLKDQLGLGP